MLPSCWSCGKHESLLQIQLHNATFFLAFAGKNILNNKLTNLNTTNCTYVWCIKNIYRAMVQQTCFCVSVTPFWGKPRRRVGQKCTKGTSREFLQVVSWEDNHCALCRVDGAIKAREVFRGRSDSITFRILQWVTLLLQVKGHQSSSTRPVQRRVAQLTFKCSGAHLKKGIEEQHLSGLSINKTLFQIISIPEINCFELTKLNRNLP